MKKIFTFGFITLLIALFMFGYLTPNRTYNDLSAMENKIAKELDASQVSIFDTQEKDEYRIVGYTADSILGFAYFELNEDEDYEYVFVKSRNEMRSVADHIYHDFMSPHEVFLSNNEALHTIKRKITYRLEFFDPEEVVDTVKVVGSPSLSILDQPHRGNQTGSYRYYDENGNEIR